MAGQGDRGFEYSIRFRLPFDYDINTQIEILHEAGYIVRFHAEHVVTIDCSQTPLNPSDALRTSIHQIIQYMPAAKFDGIIWFATP